MFRTLGICGVLGGIVAGVVIYNVGLPRDRMVEEGPPVAAPAAPKQVHAAALQAPASLQDIGGTLYPVAVAAPKREPVGQAAGASPIVIPECHLNAITTEQVPSQRDGKIQFIATEVLDPKQSVLPKDRPYYFLADVPFIRREVKQSEKVEGEPLFEKSEGKELKFYRTVREGEFLEPNKVWVGKEKKWFRELHKGDRVKKGQLLALLDMSLFYDEIQTRVTKLSGKDAERKASEKTRDEALERLKTLEILRAKSPGTVTAEEYRGAKLTADRYYFEEIQKRGEMDVTERELAQALTQLHMHEIRSDVDGKIETIYKNAGEWVKLMDPTVFQVVDQADLSVEGRVGVQNIPALPVGTEVIIEPSVQDRFKKAHPAHLYEISAVAVSKDKDNPLIVSASEDGSVRVWERAPGKDGTLGWWDNAGFKDKARFQHPVAVRAIACTPPGAAADLCLTGDAEGTCRIWNLARPSDQEPLLLAKYHRGPINCVAFSPDGRYCVAGGDDRTIVLWDLQDGHAVYTFPVGHLGGVTSVQFTPHSQLVSAGRDSRVLVWSLGEKGGSRLEAARFDRRGGDVTTLGVSPDGSEVFFDRGRELRILSLTGNTNGVLENPAGSPNFTTLALFSPDGKLALTAAGNEGSLQLWRLPTSESRGYELRQLVWMRSPTTSAAFYPHSEPGKGFVVTGTKDGQLVIWSLPSEKEITEQVKGEIILAGDSIESSSRQVSIEAKVTSNPGRPLLIGNTATIVLYPK